MAAISIAEALREPGIEAADARALLRAALQASTAHIAAHPEQRLTAAESDQYSKWVARRRAGEPVAYLTGSREFYGLAIKVTPAVLIPRPETELLVETALGLIPADAPARVLDLGTGSGCVAVAIGRHRGKARVTAVDSSRDALAVARANAAALGVAVEFVEGDWFAALPGRTFDLVLANPPYIAEADPHLEQGDLRFEPRNALVAGPTGLDCIELIVEQAPRHLAAGGRLLFEHGYDQASCARVLLEAAGYADIASYRDLAGIERVSGGRV